MLNHLHHSFWQLFEQRVGCVNTGMSIVYIRDVELKINRALSS